MLLVSFEPSGMKIQGNISGSLHKYSSERLTPLMRAVNILGLRTSKTKSVALSSSTYAPVNNIRSKIIRSVRSCRSYRLRNTYSVVVQHAPEI